MLASSCEPATAVRLEGPVRPVPAGRPRSAVPGADGRVSRSGLLALLLGVAVVTLDISLTSTALPTIAAGIGASAASTIWVVNAYYLSVVAALLPLAALGEIHGHRRIFFGGLMVFALGSLACGLSTSLAALAVSRAALGLGAAAVAATTPALIRALYPPERLGRGLGVYALVVGVAIAIGPTAASAILAVAAWQWLFLISAPVALAAFALALRELPPTERTPRRFDGVSAILCAAMLAALLFAIASVAHHGPWLHAAAALASAALCGLALRRRERGSAAPILAVDLLRIPLFALSASTSVCAFTVQGLVFVVLPFFLQFVYGYSQVEAGFLITPWPATLAVMTLVAAPLADRVATGLLGGVGLAVVGLGLGLLATLPPAAGGADIAWRLVVCGIGFGLFQSPNMKAMMSSAPRHRSGGAGGILAASRLLGQSVGAAAVAVCLSASPGRGIGLAIWLGVAVAALGCAVSLSRLLLPAEARERLRPPPA